MNLGLASGLPVANRLAKVKAINPERQSRVYVADASADGSLRTNRALLVAHGPPRTRVPEGRSKIGRRFSAGFLRFQIGPVPAGRGSFLCIGIPALKRRPIIKAPLRGAAMWDGSPRPSHRQNNSPCRL